MGVSGIWIIFLSIVGIALLVIVGYWIFYRISINKSLHSDKPKKCIPPQYIIIAVLGVLLAVSVGFSIQRIAQDFAAKDTCEYFNCYIEDSRGAAFDALFDDKDKAQQSGYFLTTWQQNGFEVCELMSGRHTSSLVPDSIIRIRYAGELPQLAEGEHLDFNFEFLYRDAMQQDEQFIGTGFEGEYKQIYVTYNCYGRYSVKMTAELKIRTNKVDNIEPFAEMLFEMGIEQS